MQCDVKGEISAHMHGCKKLLISMIRHQYDIFVLL